MDRLPSKIILDIFSRVPIKYLARSRCVSKVWCKYIDDPYLVIIHDKRVVDEPTPILYYPNESSLKTEKEWVPHCRFKTEIVPDGLFKDVIGCWNKDGDILIKSIGGDPLYVVFYIEPTLLVQLLVQ
nr:hypothetical protein [Tanacetum cinerariifolium]